MEIIERVITLDDMNKPLRIIPIGDIHIGSSGINRQYLKKTLDWIKNTPNTHWVGMGDYAECIIHTDPRFDSKSVEQRYIDQLGRIVDAQFEELEELFEPIADKCLGLVEGNHERQMRKRHTFDMTRNLAHRLGVKYLHTSAFIRLRFNRDQFHVKPLVIYAHHGWFGGRKSGGKVNQMVDFTTHHKADVYLFAHSHDILTKMLSEITPGTRGFTLHKNKKLMCSTGSFVDAYKIGASNYAEEKGLPPQKIGVVQIKVYPRVRGNDIHVSE